MSWECSDISLDKMFWIFVAAALALFIYFALIKPFNYWKDQGVLQYPYWITWRETLLGFIQYRDIGEIFQILYNDFPNCRYSGIYQFYQPSLLVRDPELIKQITVKDFDHFVDHVQMVPEDSEPLWEKNLLSLKGDKWRDMRATLSPSFTSSKMKVMFGLISECAKQFARYFEEQDTKLVTVEMKDVFTRFTNDVIASSAFGVSFDSLRDRNNDFYKMGKKITDFSGTLNNLRFMLLLMAPKLAKMFGLRLLDYKSSSFFCRIVKDNIETREREGIVRQDMIHLLMEARKGRAQTEKSAEDVDTGYAVVEDISVAKEEKRQKEQLTDVDITAQALIFFFAGFDTVSTLMCFMAHELAVNPDIQHRLLDEVDDTLIECGGSITYEALSKMKYMDMIISETLRKWPSAIAGDRLCDKPYTIEPINKDEKPVHLRKGDSILIPIFGMHRDPNLYPEPERFDPERFNDENKSSIAPYTYLPFGSGPRNCIGNRFALMETKLVFFHLLTKFEITVVEKTTIPLKLAKNQFQLNAEGGFWLGLKLRERK